MPTAAEALYPNGPKKELGNATPSMWDDMNAQERDQVWQGSQDFGHLATYNHVEKAMSDYDSIRFIPAHEGLTKFLREHIPDVWEMFETKSDDGHLIIRKKNIGS